MTLRRKALCILGLTFLGLIVALYFSARIVVLGAFARQENTETREDMQHVLNALNDDTAILAGVTRDWATWDDAYTFVQDHNSDFIRSNLAGNSAFTNNRIDLAVLVDISGRVVYSRAYDFRNLKETAVPPGLQDIPRGSPFVLSSNSTSGKTGILSLPSGGMSIAAMPILTSQGQGPARGTLIFGRYIDASELARSSRATLESLSIVPVAGAGTLPLDFRQALPALSGGNIVSRPVDDSTIEGYVLVNDIYGKPGIVLRAALPRTAYAEGETAVAYSMLVLLVVGTVFAVVSLLLLEKQVFSRLKSLGDSVSTVAAKGDFSARLALPGHDELTRLSDNINEMLAALEKAHTEQREGEVRYHAVVEQASEGIFLFDAETGKVIEANPSTLDMLGYTASEIANLTVYDLVAHDRATVSANIERTQAEGRGPIGERRYKRKDGSLIDVEIAATLITVSGKQVLCVVLRDITERKQVAEALSRERNFALQVMDAMGQGLVVAGADMRFEFVNPAFASMLGYSKEELLGKYSSDVVFPEDRSRLRNAVARRLEGHADIYELRLRKSDGSALDALVSSVPRWEDKKAVGSISVFTDLSERKHAEAVLQRQNRELAALHETTLDVMNRLDLDNLLEAVLARAAALVETPHAYLYVTDPDDPEQLVIGVGIGTFARMVGYRLRKGEGLAGRVWEAGEPIAVEDYSAWAGRRADLGHLEVKAITGIPLRSGKEITGVIGLGHIEKRSFEGLEEIALLERFAHLVSLAVDNARLYTSVRQEVLERKRAEEALHELAIRDELTGLYNRREMSRLLGEEIERCDRYERPLSLVMLDLDNFKRVNDSYGHPVGDGVLRWLVQLMRDNVRAADRLARYGGEEFAMILPETPAEEAFETAERLRRIVADRPFVFADHTGLLIEIRLTISAGVACIPTDCSDATSLIGASDRSLYEAKRGGRNRVRAARPYETGLLTV